MRNMRLQSTPKEDAEMTHAKTTEAFQAFSKSLRDKIKPEQTNNASPTYELQQKVAAKMEEVYQKQEAYEKCYEAYQKTLKENPVALQTGNVLRPNKGKLAAARTPWDINTFEDFEQFLATPNGPQEVFEVLNLVREADLRCAECSSSLEFPQNNPESLKAGVAKLTKQDLYGNGTSDPGKNKNNNETYHLADPEIFTGAPDSPISYRVWKTKIQHKIAAFPPNIDRMHQVHYVFSRLSGKAADHCIKPSHQGAYPHAMSSVEAMLNHLDGEFGHFTSNKLQYSDQPPFTGLGGTSDHLDTSDSQGPGHHWLNTPSTEEVMDFQAAQPTSQPWWPGDFPPIGWRSARAANDGASHWSHKYIASPSVGQATTPPELRASGSTPQAWSHDYPLRRAGHTPPQIRAGGSTPQAWSRNPIPSTPSVGLPTTHPTSSPPMHPPTNQDTAAFPPNLPPHLRPLSGNLSSSRRSPYALPTIDGIGASRGPSPASTDTILGLGRNELGPGYFGEP